MGITNPLEQKTGIANPLKLAGITNPLKLAGITNPLEQKILL